MYARTSFRGAKTCKIGKRVCFCHMTNFGKDMTDILTLTLSWAWWGRCEKNYLPKEEGREGGEKKRAQRARRTRGSNPGPAAC